MVDGLRRRLLSGPREINQAPWSRIFPGNCGTAGALVTDAVLRGVGFDRVWAIGDCARVPDLDNGSRPYPPTAQHAIRQGKVVADNILTVEQGRQPTEFRFRTLGVLVALGHHTAVADILGWRFSGLAAWFLWRGISDQVPGIEKRIRVLFRLAA